MNLLERAAVLVATDAQRRLRILPVLGRALVESGDWERAHRVLAEAVERGQETGERAVAADAVTELCALRLHADPTTTHEHITAELQEAIRVLEEAGHEAALARAVELSGMLLFWRGQAEAALVELERALGHAERAADRGQVFECLRSVLFASFYGPTSVEAVLRHIDGLAEHATGAGALSVSMLRMRAELEAMQGDVETARTLVAESRALAQELGLRRLLVSGVCQSAGEIELLAGDPVLAERELREGVEALEKIGDWGHLVTLIPYLVDALIGQGRGQEAVPMVERAIENVVEEDVDANMGLRRVRARLLAEQGELDTAECVAGEAVARGAPTDYLNARGRTLFDLAEVLTLAGKLEPAAAAFAEAQTLFERKGNLAQASRARARCTEIQQAQTNRRRGGSRRSRGRRRTAAARSRCRWPRPARRPPGRSPFPGCLRAARRRCGPRRAAAAAAG